MGPVFIKAGVSIYPFLIDTSGQLTLYLGDLAAKPVFEDAANREAFVVRLNAAGLGVSATTKRFNVPLAGLTPEGTSRFLMAIDWFKESLAGYAE